MHSAAHLNGWGEQQQICLVTAGSVTTKQQLQAPCLSRAQTAASLTTCMTVLVSFNIELKYPTEAELQSMASRWYSRNYFVDAVLKVLA